MARIIVRNGKCGMFPGACYVLGSMFDGRTVDDGDKDRMARGRRLCAFLSVLQTSLLTFSDVDLQSCTNLFTSS